MLTNNGIANTLYLPAELKSSCKIDIKPLVIPHPKHSIPKIYFTGHNDTENIFVKTNNATKETNPIPKECRVCLFLFLLFCSLYQRLSIAVSKAAG